VPSFFYFFRGLFLSEKERLTMVKRKQYTDKEKLEINNRHVEMFNKSLDGIELLLDGILNDLRYYDESFLELPKSLISALDFIISSLTKIQKSQRLALGLDDEVITGEVEPEINIIEGVDYTKV